MKNVIFTLLTFIILPSIPILAQRDNMTAQKVIDRYIGAIGGKNKVATIKDVTLQIEYAQVAVSLKSLDISGSSDEPEDTLIIKADLNLQYKLPNKLIITELEEGVLRTEKKFDEKKGAVRFKEYEPTLLSGDELSFLSLEAHLFWEYAFKNTRYILNLIGKEKVGDKDAYKIEIKKPNGEKFYSFYDVATGIKLRTSHNNTTISKEIIVQTIDFKNYTEIDGVKIPFTIALPGGDYTVKSVKFNSNLKDELFEVKVN